MLSRVLCHRPSPAMVVACLALAVALSGTGYAALRLPAKSVGAKQLKTGAVTNKKLARRAVTGAKVASNSLTGAQISESTLGIVPTAATAQGLAAPEPFHFVGTTGEPVFQHSWENNPMTTLSYHAGFYKDREGTVHLVGRVVGGTANNVIFQLPAGYRPATGIFATVPAACECAASQTTIVNIAGTVPDAGTAGGVSMSNGTLQPGGSLWLDGITFRAES